MAKTTGKSYRYKAFGILNPDGDVWTPCWFESEREAKGHLEDFWRGAAFSPADQFRIVPVRVTITPLAPTNRSEGGGDG